MCARWLHRNATAYRARAARGHAAKRSVDPLNVPPFDHSNVES